MSDSATFSRVSCLRAHATKQDTFVGLWMIGTVIAYEHNFLFTQSTALSYLYALVFYGVGLVYATVNGRVRHLIAIGTIGESLELLGYHFLVHIAGTLVYPTGYPFLLSSPAYMPFAWALLITFMGYIGLRLHEEISTFAAYLGPAVFAFVVESGYESLASQGVDGSTRLRRLVGLGMRPCLSSSQRPYCSRPATIGRNRMPSREILEWGSRST